MACADGGSTKLRHIAALIFALVVMCGARPALAAAPGYVLFRLDPLGIEPQIAAQLEALLRSELGHVLGQELPSKAAVDKVTLANPRLQACTASPECLVPLGRAFHATRIVSGNVGGLADSYVVNLKLVDDDGRELRRVGANLRGSPEELIAEIRVAAVRLVAPEQLVGRIEVLSGIPGAQVILDGNPVGVTPLLGPLDKIPVGSHKLSVGRDGFSSFEEDVPVRFEKTTQVVVRQSAMSKAAMRAEKRRLHQDVPVYARWYTWTGVAVGAVAVGLLVGFLVPKQHALECNKAGLVPVRLTLLLVLLMGSASAAERVAVLPIVAVAKDPLTLKLTADVEAALVDATSKVAGVVLTNDDGGRLHGPRLDAHADQRPQARGEALARELSVLAVVAEPQPLGDGAVVYLTIIEPSGRVRGSTTVALSHYPNAGGLQRPLRGGLVQVLDPSHYTGRLDLRVDVKGAQTEIDGRATAITGAVSLSVGPHAVRVTHPAYHDYTRFVDIAFDETRTEPVALAAFPLTEGEMAEKRRRGVPLPPRKVPWYRSWWALTVGGAVLTGATIGIVLGARPGLTSTHDTTYKAVPTP